MQRLRASFAGQPFERQRIAEPRLNPKIIMQKGRLRRLMREGIIEPMTKAEARKACDEAALTHAITKCDPKWR